MLEEAWLTMECAPRNGTKIDIWAKSSRTGKQYRQTDVAFIEDDWCYLGSGRNGNPHDSEWLEILDEPLFWMAPPKGPDSIRALADKPMENE